MERTESLLKVDYTITVRVSFVMSTDRIFELL
jgi:hypothetical protein